MHTLWIETVRYFSPYDFEGFKAATTALSYAVPWAPYLLYTMTETYKLSSKKYQDEIYGFYLC